jgi:hypothetical protein
MVDRGAIDELIGLDLRPAVSVLMPTHRAGPEIRQDPIRLKNLLRDVERQLDIRGHTEDEIARILAPAVALVEDRAFWRHQEDSLALYAAPNFFRQYGAARALRERAVVSERFQVLPLLPLITGDGRFYVLALSQKDVRLLEATRSTVREIDLGDLPRSVPEALLTDTPERQIQQHVDTIAGSRHAFIHGHGEGLGDRKDDILQFFHRIDRGLRRFLVDPAAPLVLAGVDYLLPLYRKANTHPALLADGVLGSPEGLSAETLRARAWEVARLRFEAAQTSAAERYQEAVGAGRASADLGLVLRAAYEGRVSELFVAEDVDRWGTFAPDSGVMSLGNGPGAAREDVLNLAVIGALQRGSAIHVLDQSLVPAESEVAAILRY